MNASRPLSDLQRRVVAQVREQLGEAAWFAGICLDELPSDAEIERVGFIAACDRVRVDTATWDAPAPAAGCRAAVVSLS